MYKKIFVFLSFILLSNCSTPATAFLGPIITGAKTGSVYQASLSYGSNKIINSIKEIDKNKISKFFGIFLLIIAAKFWMEYLSL